LFPKGHLTFEELDDAARSGHGLTRLGYRRGSHHVHASVWTLVLNSALRGGTVYLTTGPTNIGLEDPAQVALAALLDSCEAVVRGVEDPPEPMHLVSLKAMLSMSTETLELFDECDELVLSREARLQTRRR
jgi:hypothetical protein